MYQLYIFLLSFVLFTICVISIVESIVKPIKVWVILITPATTKNTGVARKPIM